MRMKSRDALKASSPIDIKNISQWVIRLTIVAILASGSGAFAQDQKSKSSPEAGNGISNCEKTTTTERTAKIKRTVSKKPEDIESTQKIFLKKGETSYGVLRRVLKGEFSPSDIKLFAGLINNWNKEVFPFSPVKELTCIRIENFNNFIDQNKCSPHENGDVVDISCPEQMEKAGVKVKVIVGE